MEQLKAGKCETYCQTKGYESAIYRGDNTCLCYDSVPYEELPYRRVIYLPKKIQQYKRGDFSIDSPFKEPVITFDVSPYLNSY
jgi:hypothetical protein